MVGRIDVQERSLGVLLRAGLLTVASSVVAVFGLAWVGSTPAYATTGTVMNWSDLQSDFTSSGTITLGADITAPSGASLIMTAGSTVTLDLNGFTLDITSPAAGMAGIQDVGVSEGFQTSGDSLTINGPGTLNATGGPDDADLNGGAGIGGNDGKGIPENGGALTINGGTINASGTDTSAGIGGGWDGSGGSVTVTGGTVNALGGTFGAGIGGALGDSTGGTVTITGGTVHATGGTTPPADCNGTNDCGGPGIGVGIDPYAPFGGGTDVVIGVNAVVTATSNGSYASAIGQGINSVGNPSFGSLSNSGNLTLVGGEIVTTDVTAANGEFTNTATGVINLDTSLKGGGTVVNNGTIIVNTAVGGSLASDGTTITQHNYAVTYNLNGATGTTPDPQIVYAATFTADDASLPNPPTGYGWSNQASGGVPVTNTTNLATLFGESSTGPTNVTLYLVLVQSAAKTSLTATPALLQLYPGLALYLFTLNATLTGPSGPIAGQTIVFSAGSAQVCTAVTGSKGTATCSGLAAGLTILISGGYNATFAGNAKYLPASASAGLIGLGTIQLL